MKPTKFYAVSLVTLVLLCVCGAAKAGIQMMHVDLVCYADKNMAQIHFSIEDIERIQYQDYQPDQPDCTLANGNTIRVRGGVEQAFGHGMGGGNPPAFFSLWVNRHKIFSRKEWKPGYENSFANLPVYDSLLVETNKITICATAEGKPQRCSSQPVNLTKAPIDNIEYGPDAGKLQVGQFSVIAKGADNQRFCQAYLDSIKPGGRYELGVGTSLDIDYMSLRPESSRTKDGAHSSLIELLPGSKRRLMIWDNASGYFDGSVMVLAPAETKAQQITSAYPLEDIDGWPTHVIPEGFTLISGGQKQLYPNVSLRYVNLTPQRIDGALYVFAYPTNYLVRPTAALVKPLAKGGFVTLCAFNRTEPHY